MIGALAVFGLPALAAWSCIYLCRTLSPGERLACAIACTVALPSIAFWVWRGPGGAPGSYASLDPWIWISVTLACLATRLKAPTPRGDRNPLQGLLPITLITIVATGIAVAHAVRYAAMNPLGAWDAWAIWNLRARFLAVPELGHTFDPALAWSHTDYPLLVPAAVARGWVAGGTVEHAVPLAIGVACGIGSIVAVADSIHRHRGLLMAAVAAALVAVPAFLAQAASQQADIPLSFFTVLAVVLASAPGAGAVHLGLAGAALGCAAWTKNEGIIVALVFPAVFLLLQARRRGFHAATQAAVDIAIGLVPVLVIVALFKIFFAPANDVIDGILRPGVFWYWRDEVRVAFVFRYMTTEALRWGGWWSGAGPLIAVMAVALVRRTDRATVQLGGSAAGWLLMVQLAVFAAVYVMTPHSVAWHMQTSWARLIAQFWPTLVWWACMRSGLGALRDERTAMSTLQPTPG